MACPKKRLKKVLDSVAAQHALRIVCSDTDRVVAWLFGCPRENSAEFFSLLRLLVPRHLQQRSAGGFVCILAVRASKCCHDALHKQRS